MKLLDDLFWWNTDGANKQLCTFLNDDINQVIQTAFGVVIVGLSSSCRQRGNEQVDTEGYTAPISLYPLSRLETTYEGRARSARLLAL